MNVLVTGASSGIGRATAELLGARGHRVLAGVRGESDLRVPTVQLDVTDAGQVDALRALELGGLVNNAGIAVTGPLEFMPLAELRRQFEVNTVAQLAVTQACLPALRRARGRIVMVSSIAGRAALPIMGPYATSKFALEGMSDSLRRELRGAVDVILVEPGAIATPIWNRSLTAGEALWAAMPAVAHERYAATVDALRREAAKQAEQGAPPEAVAHTIAAALSAPRPRARYVV